MIETADICFFVLIIGGTLNILVEMDSLSSGMRALSRVAKGKEFLLLILILIFVSIGGTTYVISFYPILMPIFLKNGFDGILSMASLYLGAAIGNIFCTICATSVVLASITAGINFIDGIILRIIGLIIGLIITIIYLYFYYKRVQKDETKSIVYEIRQKLLDKYLKRRRTWIREKKERRIFKK